MLRPAARSRRSLLPGSSRKGSGDAVDGLPEKLRVVVVLGALEGHGLGEVAGLLGVPVGTVKSRLHEARRRLLEKLKWAVSDTKKS